MNPPSAKICDRTDFSTLSRRGSDLTLQPTQKSNSNEAIHLAIDSTGLKIFGEG
jgi:hypothetical protein